MLTEESTHDVNVTIAPEDWKRGVFRTATGIILCAKPTPDADEEVHIDMPADVAAWVARHILSALDVPPCTPAQLCADEGYRVPTSAPTDAS